MIGQTVSHYEILGKLGEGGMGVVYKAEDLKLTRTVALKFLPHGLDVHEGERARFLQEARAAAILNHPNICTVYDIQEHDDQPFIVMEFVEGKTLRDLVPVSKMQDAITYAIQIADALQEAHTHGIVHRDIKAENIMVNAKNQVKVMDFGLAKLKGSLKLTKTSSTVGTLAYMAPEQIQGGEVDARNDIFSFGVVLYEMLTGHLPFRGDHDAAMMYSILNEEPAALQQYLADAPSELLHTVNRALEKDPEERYQTVREMLIDLRRLKKESTRVARQVHQAEKPLRTDVPVMATGGIWWRKRWLWPAALGLIVVGVGLTVLLVPKNRGVKLNPNRAFSALQVPFRQIGLPSVSRDGNWVVFPAEDDSGKWDVYWMNIAGGDPSKIAHEGSVYFSVDVSPDDGQVAYDCRIRDRSGIRIVPIQGGASRTVADTGCLPRWSPDGKRVGYLRWGTARSGTNVPSVSGKLEIWSVKPDGSDNRLEFIDSLHASSTMSFCWSPDGASIAWLRNFSSAYGEVMTRELATERERQLTSDRAQVDEVIWTTSDRIIFVSNKSGQSNLWVIPSGGGEATQVTQGTVPIVSARISADTRKLVYLQHEAFWQLWISALDGSNARQVTYDEIRPSSSTFSPDGNHIACVLRDVDIYRSETHLYVMDRQGKNRRALTAGSEVVGRCKWSPDGKWLAYVSRSTEEPVDSNEVYLIQPFNPGAARLLCKGRWFYWIDSENLVVRRGMKTWRHSIVGGIPSQLYRDSTMAIPLKGGNQIFFVDYGTGREGFWLVSVDSLGKEVEETRRLLLSRKNVTIPYFVFPPDMRFMDYQISDTKEIWRMWLPGGRIEQVGSLPSETIELQDVSMDGKEILWRKDNARSKLALIENLFE